MYSITDEQRKLVATSDMRSSSPFTAFLRPLHAFLFASLLEKTQKNQNTDHPLWQIDATNKRAISA